MSLWDVAMAPVRAAGGAFHELDMATQGTTAKREREHRQLINDLQAAGAATPDNTPARIEAMRAVMSKHGLSMPPMMNAQGGNQYEQIPTPYERGMGQYAEARTAAANKQKRIDPVDKAKAVSELIGSRPWSEDQEYDPANPEHRIWMQSMEGLGDGSPEQAPDEGARPGSALRSIPVAPAEGPKQAEPMTMAGAMTRAAGQPNRQPAGPAAGAASPWGEVPLPSPSSQEMAKFKRPGSALSQIPLPQVEAAMGQYEQAGGVTTRNANQVAASKAAPASMLTAASKGIKAYQASPEYAKMVLATGRQLKDTDLSGPAKGLLAGESSANQKRLLGLIHKYGEAAVMQAVQGSQKPKGDF